MIKLGKISASSLRNRRPYNFLLTRTAYVNCLRKLLTCTCFAQFNFFILLFDEYILYRCLPNDALIEHPVAITCSCQSL